MHYKICASNLYCNNILNGLITIFLRNSRIENYNNVTAINNDTNYDNSPLVVNQQMSV